MAWELNLGFVKVSNKGVEAKPQFKVGYEDEHGGIGGGVDFSDGVKVSARADATVDGKKYGAKVLLYFSVYIINITKIFAIKNTNEITEKLYILYI